MTFLRAIDHVQLAIPAGAEAQCTVFYAGVLGFAEVPKPAALAGRGGAWFRAGSIDLHLGVDPDFHPARKAHPAFLVDDLGALADRLRRAGIAVHPDTALEGVARFFADDPVGNRLEFLERES